MRNQAAITPSLENYIEVLYELHQQDAQVRVTDLAKRLGIAKSSVNQAVAHLVRLGLALHERYGKVELTETGAAYAGRLQERHRILQTFFTDILHVEPATADNDACIIEHVISPATMQKFTEYLQMHEQLAAPADETIRPVARIVTLDKLRPGGRARVMRITARGAVRQRIMDMGVTAGAELLVEKVAPMGDPIEIRVKGYTLALRSTEAHGVIVEILQ